MIAADSVPFTGVFNGGGFIIRNLTINSEGDQVGLFGQIGDGGIVTELGMVDADIGGRQNVGVLAGSTLAGSSIVQCFSTGAVVGTGDHSGGLVGSSAGAIRQSFSIADVTGVNHVGGLAGYNMAPDTISQTYSTGQIVGTGTEVGGLMGCSPVSSRKAVMFDGDADYIALSKPLSIFNSSFTIEMWAYFNDDGRGILLGDYSLSGAINTNFERYTSGQLRIYWNNGALNYYTDADVVGTGRWEHLAFQRDKDANVFRIFVDGKLVSTFDDAGVDLAASIPHYLGRDSRTGSTALNGRMSDVRIWNTVRTETEIRADRYQPLSGNEPGLAGYWKLDEGTGAVAHDSTAGGNHGYCSLSVVPDLGPGKNDGAINGASPTPVIDQSFSSAMTFNGDSDCVILSKPLPIFGGSFTIEMWAYFNDSGRDVLLGDYSLAGAIQTNFEKYTDGRLRIYWNGGNPNYLTNAGMITTNTWQHIAFQRDKAAGLFRVFVNGALVGSYANIGNDLSASIPHYLGRDSRTGTTAMNGQLADVRIWNYARTHGDIQADMNAVLAGSEAGLLDYWRFDQEELSADLSWDETVLMTDSFWDKENSLLTVSSGGIGVSTAQMRQIDTFLGAGWDMENDWSMLAASYPVLAWQMLSADLDRNGIVDSRDFASVESDWFKRADELPEYPEFSMTNPYAEVDWGTAGQYKANMHTHTTMSDGSDDPATVIDVYHSLGYNILAITDHDTSSPSTPTWPWTDYGRDPVALDMIAIEGNEISRPHHTLSYFCDYGNPSETLCEQAIIGIGNQGGLAVLAHPVYTNHYLGTQGLPAGMTWTSEVYANLFKQYTQLVGMEVYNHITHMDAHRPVWDAILTLTMPDRPVWGFSNDDSHSPSHRGYGYEIFLLSDPNEQGVRTAMENGSFYFGYAYEVGKSGPTIHSIDVDVLTGHIHIHASDYERIDWISRGKVVEIGDEIRIDASSSVQNYIRAEIIGSSGVAFTQPFGVINPCRYLHEHGMNYAGDIDQNCKVDMSDLKILATQWLDTVWR